MIALSFLQPGFLFLLLILPLEEQFLRFPFATEDHSVRQHLLDHPAFPYVALLDTDLLARTRIA